MNWFTLSLSSVVALAIAELTQQHLLNQKNPFTPRSSAVLTFLVQAFFTIPIILFMQSWGDISRLFNLDLFPKVLFTTIIGSIGMVFYLTSFKVKNISISTIFVSLSVVVSTTLGILLFSESILVMKFVGIGLILAAIVSLNINNLVLEKNHFYGLIAGLCFGVTYTMDKMILMSIHPITYVFMAFTFVSLFGFLMKPSEVVTDLRRSPPSSYKPIFFSGVGYFIYNLFTFFAYKAGGEVGRVDAINNSQVFLIILFEILVLKHTKGIIKKVMAAVIAFVGVAILGFY